MNNVTKGAVAAALGAVLLVGGGSTLASWTASTDPDGGGAITSGHLDLVTDATNTGCGSWNLAGVGTYTAGAPLVPGDVLTMQCTFTVDALGANLEATVDVDTPTFSGTDGDFDGTLDATVSGLTVGGTPATTLTGADDGEALRATVQVTFDDQAANSTMDMATVLDDLSLTATQVVP